MGRHSNIILVDQTKNMILDSIKHVPSAVNTHRIVLPGHEYISPPEQHKANPFEADEQDVLRRLDFNAGKLDKQIVSQYAGISPLFAKEVTFQAGLVNRTTVPQAFLALIGRVKQHEYSPSIMEIENKESFYLFPLAGTKSNVKSFPTLGDMLDRYYFGKAERDRVKQQANDIERLIVNEKEKTRKKSLNWKKLCMKRIKHSNINYLVNS